MLDVEILNFRSFSWAPCLGRELLAHALTDCKHFGCKAPERKIEMASRPWLCAAFMLCVILSGRWCKAGVNSIVPVEDFEDDDEGVSFAACNKASDYPGEHRSSPISALGDGGMKDNRVRVALESWNFCNKVGYEQPTMPSPRQADCSNILCNESGACQAELLVKVADNGLKSGQAFPQGTFIDSPDPDQYAVQKELFLGSLCETKSDAGPWHFWMIMLKNGNFDVNSDLCPSTASKPTRPFTRHYQWQFGQLPFPTSIKSSFPCFGAGCMNHPMIYHNWSNLQPPSCQDKTDVVCNESSLSLSGSFYGTYDLKTVGEFDETIGSNSSYFSVDWTKDATTGSWLFHHVLRVNHYYPWLMLYLRADATHGLSGGYPWETRGMIIQVPQSPNFKVKLTLDVRQGGGSASQFYLLDIGGCWKNDGKECDGDTTTDVTRYSEMIINPNTDNWCKPTDVSLCPPYHVDAYTKRKIYRNDTSHFPYAAYHLYCIPPNAKFAEPPFRVCDPYSNPQPQEIMQILPHPQWSIHGYPSTKGQGWVGDPTTWTLDVGGLSQRLYFYQDPNTQPAPRKWTSIDVGTEIYISGTVETAEWIVSDFDVILQ